MGGLAFAPDGRRLASADGHRARVTDVEANQTVATVTGHAGRAVSFRRGEVDNRVLDLAWTADGQLVSAAVDGLVVRYDGRTLAVVAEHRVDPDGTFPAFRLAVPHPDDVAAGPEAAGRVVLGGLRGDAGGGPGRAGVLVGFDHSWQLHDDTFGLPAAPVATDVCGFGGGLATCGLESSGVPNLCVTLTEDAGRLARVGDASLVRLARAGPATMIAGTEDGRVIAFDPAAVRRDPAAHRVLGRIEGDVRAVAVGPGGRSRPWPGRPGRSTCGTCRPARGGRCSAATPGRWTPCRSRPTDGGWSSSTWRPTRSTWPRSGST